MKSLFLKSVVSSFVFCLFSVLFLKVLWALTKVSLWDPLTATRWNDIVDYVTWNSIPSWAIMAFNLSSCPQWWSEYTIARWRFLRWLDNWAWNDPDCSTRSWWCVVGSTQVDAFKSHSHWMLVGWWWYNSITSEAWRQFVRDNWVQWTVWVWIGYNWWNETRPKNVAVLYCIKN